MEHAEKKHNTIEILHPEVWSLAVRLSSGKLVYAVHSRMEDNSLIYGEIPFSGTEENDVKEIESIVYDNRFFLYDYETRHFLSESSHFLLIPDEFSAGGDYSECCGYYRHLYPDDNLAVRTDRIDSCGVTLAFGIDHALDSFLRRTFDNPPVMHCLTPMIRFLKSKENFGSAERMYVYVNDGKVEIIAFKGGKLVFSNFFSFDAIEDAFYYIMNAWHVNGFDRSDAEIHILGEKRCRKALLPELRRYVPTVVQSIFPARLLRMGKNAMEAPFDLIVLPLCE